MSRPGLKARHNRLRAHAHEDIMADIFERPSTSTLAPERVAGPVGTPMPLSSHCSRGYRRTKYKGILR
jgi:hypothetical protein